MFEMVLLGNGSGKNTGIMLRSIRHSDGMVLEVLFRSGTALPLRGTELLLKQGKRKVEAVEIIAKNTSFVRMKITALPN